MTDWKKKYLLPALLLLAGCGPAQVQPEYVDPAPEIAKPVSTPVEIYVAGDYAVSVWRDPKEGCEYLMAQNMNRYNGSYSTDTVSITPRMAANNMGGSFHICHLGP